MPLPAIITSSLTAARPGFWSAAWAYWLAGGWLMLPLAMTAFLIWFRYLYLWRVLHGALAAPEDFPERLEQRLRAGATLPQLTAWLRELPGTAPRLVHELLQRRQPGQPVGAVFAQCREAEFSYYSHAFYFLGALVTAAPLLGLLGTVLGMMTTFNAVALQSRETPELMGRGLSEALITTQFGLAVALPGTFGMAHLFRLYRRLSNTVARCESHLSAALTGPETQAP